MPSRAVALDFIRFRLSQNLELSPPTKQSQNLGQGIVYNHLLTAFPFCPPIFIEAYPYSQCSPEPSECLERRLVRFLFGRVLLLPLQLLLVPLPLMLLVPQSALFLRYVGLRSFLPTIPLISLLLSTKLNTFPNHRYVSCNFIRIDEINVKLDAIADTSDLVRR